MAEHWGGSQEDWELSTGKKDKKHREKGHLLETSMKQLSKVRLLSLSRNLVTNLDCEAGQTAQLLRALLFLQKTRFSHRQALYHFASKYRTRFGTENLLKYTVAIMSPASCDFIYFSLGDVHGHEYIWWLYMYKLEANVKCLPLLLSTVVLEIGFLTEAGAPRIRLCSLPPAVGSSPL